MRALFVVVTDERVELTLEGGERAGGHWASRFVPANWGTYSPTQIN
jgi:hypothetical protein